MQTVGDGIVSNFAAGNSGKHAPVNAGILLTFTFQEKFNIHRAEHGADSEILPTLYFPGNANIHCAKHAPNSGNLPILFSPITKKLLCHSTFLPQHHKNFASAEKSGI